MKNKTDKVRWGVLGVASIAVRRAVPAMQRGRYSEVTAIASRDRSKAEEAALELMGPDDPLRDEVLMGLAKASLLVKSAFALQPEETEFLDIVDLGERARRVPIANRQIALFPQRVIRKVVFLQIPTHIAVGPVENRMNLVLTALELNGIGQRSRTRL